MSKEELCSTTTMQAGQPILWRIIGVFNDKLRIVRDESIGDYSWDTSASDVNSGRGINEWSQADLMKLLNPGYENNIDKDREGNDITVNNSLYWTSGSGNCYISSRNSTGEFNFTNSGLSDEAKGYVIDQTLFLGGFDTYNVFANNAYIIERNFENVIQNPSDGVTRTLTWTGKVGLPYPSDFGYAADFRDSNCQGDLSTFGSCTANWMNKGTPHIISPLVDDASWVLCFGHGSLTRGSAFANYDVYPTLLLEETVEIESGNGSKETPYVVAY